MPLLFCLFGTALFQTNHKAIITRKSMYWYVYLIRTRHGALYTGISKDVFRRLVEHQQGTKKGSKYLRWKGPLQLAYSAKIGSRALALKIEGCIKRLPKRKKEAIVEERLTAKALLKLLL